MWVKALTWRRYVAAKATSSFTEAGGCLVGDHSETHWVAQVWGKWLLWLLQLQSLVPHFPQSETHLTQPTCVRVSCLVYVTHAKLSVSVHSFDQKWSVIKGWAQSWTQERKIQWNTEYLLNEQIHAPRTLVELQKLEKTDVTGVTSNMVLFRVLEFGYLMQVSVCQSITRSAQVSEVQSCDSSRSLVC